MIGRSESIRRYYADKLGGRPEDQALAGLYYSGHIDGSRVAHINEHETAVLELIATISDEDLSYLIGSDAMVAAIMALRTAERADEAERAAESRAEQEAAE